MGQQYGQQDVKPILEINPSHAIIRKMKNIYILPLILFIISCGKKGDVIEEKFSNGQKKLVVEYGDNEEIIKKRLGIVTGKFLLGEPKEMQSLK